VWTLIAWRNVSLLVVFKFEVWQPLSHPCDTADSPADGFLSIAGVAGKEEFERTLEEDEALYNRDAVSKSLYNALFAWVVRKINAALYRGEVENVNWIGILDVFGFECFEHNSFEQVHASPQLNASVQHYS